MNLLKTITEKLNRQPPYEVSYSKPSLVYDLHLLIHQKSDDASNARRVAGVTVNYTNKHMWSLELEPSGNIDALRQLLEYANLQVEDNTFPRSAERTFDSQYRRRIARGKDHAGIPDITHTPKEWIEKCDHYAGVLRPYVEEAGEHPDYPFRNQGEPVFHILREKGFLSEDTVKMLQKTLEFCQARSGTRPPDIRGLKKALNETLKNDATPGDSSPARV